MNKYTIVTVVFPAEVDLLLLQARSFSIYCDPELVHQIIIIDNSAKGLGDKDNQRMKSAYGHLSSIVKIVRNKDVAKVPPSGGWWHQQVLKLCVARIIETERYVVLDPKQHLVAPLNKYFLESPDGRATINTYNYSEHPLKNKLLHTIKYVGIQQPTSMNFTATVPPFTIFTNVSRELIDEIEKMSGLSFENEFISNKLLEFFLYGAWLVKTSQLNSLYVDHQKFCPTIWEHTATTDGVKAAVDRASDFSLPFFAVHRNAYARLDQQSSNILAEFWSQRNLWPSAAQGSNFIDARKRRDKFDRWSKRFATLTASVRAKLLRKAAAN